MRAVASAGDLASGPYEPRSRPAPGRDTDGAGGRAPSRPGGPERAPAARSLSSTAARGAALRPASARVRGRRQQTSATPAGEPPAAIQAAEIPRRAYPLLTRRGCLAGGFS